MLKSPLLLAPALFVLASCQCAPSPAQGCQIDADCPGQRICSTTLKTCVDCTLGDQCSSGLCLPDGTCSSCGPNAECPQGQVCAVDGQCRIGCASDTAGCPSGQFCVPGTDTCVECLNDMQCGAGRICSPGHTCTTGCSATNPSCAPMQVCDVDAGACVECQSNSDCRDPARPACDLTRNVCVACTRNGDCRAAATPICDTAHNICVACVADQDCGAGKICQNETCVPGCSTAHPTCPTGQVCDTQNNSCVQCLNDSQCGGVTPRCNTQSNTCVACLPTNDNCPTGQYCRTDFVCERGCKTGADCPSGVCRPDHSCSSCTLDSQCAAGNVCQNGTCVAACSATNPCGQGQECCGARCINKQTDAQNCGACGNVCGAGTTCCGGTCARLDTVNNCGVCGNACGTGQGCCAGACQSLNSLSRCGSCNTACGVDQFCDGQSCQAVQFPNFCANRTVYAVYDGIALDDAATNVLASTIRTNCSATTVITYGPQSNPNWVDQTTGQLLFGSGVTVVTAGGPFPNKPVKWLERTQMATKVYFSTNGVDTYSFKRRSDDSTAASILVSACNPHHDIFVMELARDPVNGTLALIEYGVCTGGYGTQAGAWFYANTMLPNRMSYPDGWYVFEWTDGNNDSLPNMGDTFTVLSSGN